MTAGQTEVLGIAVLVSWACCLPGIWLVLRGSAMLVDAISHTVLLGIVLAFFLAGDLTSPLLRLGAALVGILTVVLVDLLGRHRLVRTDAAIGLVFPVLFAAAVLLVSRFAGSVHLDIDVVLTGEIGLTPFDRIAIGSWDIPRAMAYLAIALAINATLTGLFWKELKASSFDPALAASLGLAPGLIGLGLVAVVSITAVTAFEAIGSILVVALVVGPPATALLLTNSLPRMLMWALGLSVSAAGLGYLTAWSFDTTIAGSIAAAIGTQFALSALFSPHRGIIARQRRRRRQALEFAQMMLVTHLQNHEGTDRESEENALAHLHLGLRWQPEFAQTVTDRSVAAGLIEISGNQLRLLDPGRKLARWH